MWQDLCPHWVPAGSGSWQGAGSSMIPPLQPTAPGQDAGQKSCLQRTINLRLPTPSPPALPPAFSKALFFPCIKNGLFRTQDANQV